MLVDGQVCLILRSGTYVQMPTLEMIQVKSMSESNGMRTVTPTTAMAHVLGNVSVAPLKCQKGGCLQHTNTKDG